MVGVDKLAIECILLAMEEIKKNLQDSALVEDVEANARAMLILSEAYRNIKGRK